jgi:hypothetical protein
MERLIKRIEDWDVIITTNPEHKKHRQELIDFLKKEYGYIYNPLPKEEIIRRMIKGIESRVDDLMKEIIILMELVES